MRVVLANGCFDPIHSGHVLHLQAARKMGDYLTVAVTDDLSVRREKGEGRPVLNAWTRCNVLTELRCVDGAFIVPGVMHALRRMKPAVFVKGPDYFGQIDPEVEQYCREHGIDIRFTDTPKLSATELLRELRSA